MNEETFCRLAVIIKDDCPHKAEILDIFNRLQQHGEVCETCGSKRPCVTARTILDELDEFPGEFDFRDA